MEERTAFRTCPFCEATCGLAVTVRGDEVVKVRGDADDVFSHGFLCPKGVALQDLHEDPDRLRTPLLRGADGELRPASWDEALGAIAERLPPLLEAHGRDAVAVYIGNPAAHGLAALLYGRVLLKALGTKSIFSASTVDQRPKEISSALMFGTALSVPIPDVDRTSHLLVLGANPLASNGSLLTAPDMRGRLRALRARGGKLVVVDPRRSRTAEEADEHHPIRPGTDALLLFALVHVLFAEDLVRPLELADGVAEVEALAQPFTPEAVAPATGIGADAIRRMARELAAAEAAAVYGRIGTTTQEFGTLASWLVDVLNVLTGNLDRPGGAMFPLAAAGQRNASGAPGRGRAAPARPLALARARAARVAGRAARRGAGGGDRDAGRRAGPGADHARRQPGALDAELGADGARARGPRPLRRARHLRQRVDAPRRRDPPGAVAAASAATTTSRSTSSRCATWRTGRRPRSRSPTGQPDEWETLLRLAGIAAGQGVHGRRRAARRPGRGRARAARGRGRRGDAGRRRAAHRPGAAARHPAALRAVRPHARRPRGGAARDRPRAARAAAAGRAADAVGADRAGAGADRRRRGAAARGARPRARPGGARADRPPPAALEQLVDAQPAAARLRPGALHAPRPPGRRGAARPRRRRARRGAQPHGRGARAGRGDRPRDGGRRLAPARLGPRRAGRAAGRRGGARGGERERARRRGAGRRAERQRRARTGSRSRSRPSARPWRRERRAARLRGARAARRARGRGADGARRAAARAARGRRERRGAAGGGGRGAARAPARGARARRQRRPDRAAGGGDGRASTSRRSRRSGAPPGSRSRRPTSPCSASST